MVAQQCFVPECTVDKMYISRYVGASVWAHWLKSGGRVSHWEPLVAIVFLSIMFSSLCFTHLHLSGYALSYSSVAINMSTILKCLCGTTFNNDRQYTQHTSNCISFQACIWTAAAKQKAQSEESRQEATERTGGWHCIWGVEWDRDWTRW